MTSNDPALRQVLDMCQERGNELEQLVVDSLQGAALGDAADSGALLVEARRRRLAVLPKMIKVVCSKCAFRNRHDGEGSCEAKIEDKEDALHRLHCVRGREFRYVFRFM